MATSLEELFIAPQSLSRFEPLVGEERMRETDIVARETAHRMVGRAWWNVSSTARGGGVAEMLRSLLAFARGADIDARWAVIHGTPEFFMLTKRLHHALHGMQGDGSALGEPQRRIYESTLQSNAKELLPLVRPRDVVLLHDPQTAGLAPYLARHGAIVIWRSHIGIEEPNEQTRLAWEFLDPYLQDVDATVFSREAYIPPSCKRKRWAVIPPSIDAFSAKNQPLDDATVRAILVQTGLVEGPPGDGQPIFHREDGTPARVDRQAVIIRQGRAPEWERNLIVQVSRWDPLKDPIGVMHGFAMSVSSDMPADSELVLAGPSVTAVADDPEGAETFAAVVDAWRQLPDGDRDRIHLVSLPMADIEENAAIVNALQRHAAVVVQKSLREGFGLTVTEAMWKGRPMVASRVGGIQDQITDGVDGLLVEPTDLSAFNLATRAILDDPSFASRLGANARQRIINDFLGVRHLEQYAHLLADIESARPD
ncbi:MAG TPA: glycosyltransferase [Thermomicrobiales bacterium]|nr:glycosyltransferase [Thermomicrobiales bacterium]